MYSIFDELSQPIFVHIDAPCLSMMNVAFHNSRISAGFHLKTSNAIVVDVILLEISLFAEHK